jgi:hypothetical protein
VIAQLDAWILAMVWFTHVVSNTAALNAYEVWLSIVVVGHALWFGKRTLRGMESALLVEYIQSS